MHQKALGLIETIGLTAAVEAADAAVKSANVTLVGYELAKGGGMTVVKLQGDVGAVKAAVDAGAAAAAKVNKVVSVKVIPRPAVGIAGMVFSPDTVGSPRRRQQETGGGAD
jgi:microcompartment protein CcmL/EutN